MTAPRVFADFHNADARGRLRLNCIGTTEDLARQRVELREGLELALYADDLDANGAPDELVADGVVTFSADESCWVAMIDWQAIRHASLAAPKGANGAAPRNTVPGIGKNAK